VREAFSEKYSRAGLWKKSWADPPTGQPTRAACLIEKFVAFLWQIAPIKPVLPTQPTYKPFTVNKTPNRNHLHTVEVAGSNPAAPTKTLSICRKARLWRAFVCWFPCEPANDRGFATRLLSARSSDSERNRSDTTLACSLGASNSTASENGLVPSPAHPAATLE